jgi:hypothetical protein
MTTVNDEGRMSLDLPSSRKAILRPYDAWVADAIGDAALDEDNTNLDKAISGLVESLDGETFPNWDDDSAKAINTARDMLLNDYLFILFMAVASYRDGFFEGDVPDRDGGTFYARLQLLDKNGLPLDQYKPPDYPLGKDKICEWDEEIGGKQTKFKFDLLDGHARAAILSSGGVNLNTAMVNRKPRYHMEGDPAMEQYNPKMHPPAAISKAFAKKMREIDPVIQFNATFTNPKGQKITHSLFGVPDFFLRDFT